MEILEQVVDGLPDGMIEDIRVGEHWTAVVAQVNGKKSCGLASNPYGSFTTVSGFQDKLRQLKQQGSAKDLTGFATQTDTPLASIGMAAINALIPPRPGDWTDTNASEMIAQKGQGKRVVLVGHFPFVPELKSQVGDLQVLEQKPQEGDLHANLAPQVIPQAAVVAITSMAFINGTMEGLLELCAPQAYVIVLGPSTPLSPVLFEHGIDMLCGSIVEAIPPVLEGVEAGMRFRQIQHLGVRLVSLPRPAAT